MADSWEGSLYAALINLYHVASTLYSSTQIHVTKLGVTILNFFDSRLSTAILSAIYDIIVSVRGFLKNTRSMEKLQVVYL